MSPGRLLGVIAHLPLFQSVSRPHLAQLARQAYALHVRRGATVCRRGESVTGFYGLAYGLVKLALRAEGGAEKVLRLVGPGETFGEALVFKARPNPLDAVALADTMLVVFPSAAVNAMIATEPEFARSMLAGLSERMHAMVAEVESGALYSARQRLAAYLGSLCADGRASRARLPASKTVIAARLGVTKETLSRLLHDFAQAGLIAIEQRTIVLHDRQRLAQEAVRPAARLSR